MGDLLLCCSKKLHPEKLISHTVNQKTIVILDFLNIAANLKAVPRQGWIEKCSIMNPESVADHSFSMAVIGMIFSDSQNHDTAKILKMILLHDLAESITGDFTPEQKSREEKLVLERSAIQKILANLPDTLQRQYLSLWNEYQANETKESNLVHQVDKLEMALQAKIYSRQKNSVQDFSIFFDSAKKGIDDPNILELFKQLND